MAQLETTPKDTLIELKLTEQNEEDEVKKAYSDDELGIRILYNTETKRGQVLFETSGLFGGKDDNVKYEFENSDFRKAVQRIINYRLKFITHKLNIGLEGIESGRAHNERNLSSVLSSIDLHQQELNRYMKREITNCPN